MFTTILLPQFLTIINTNSIIGLCSIWHDNLFGGIFGAIVFELFVDAPLAANLGNCDALRKAL